MSLISRRRHLQWMSFITIATVKSARSAQSEPTIAAASDLQFLLPELASAFEKESGIKLRLIFGASGTLCTQILQGAPFDMFMSADSEYVRRLSQNGKTRDEGVDYAVGRLGIFVSDKSSIKADGKLVDLINAVVDGRLTKLAIASPIHAPYGQRSMEVLKKIGAWEAVTSKLLIAENVSQAAQYVMSGGAQVAFIAKSLAISKQVNTAGKFELIPDEWHKPLNQKMVLLRGALRPVELFYEFIRRPDQQAVFRKNGF
jgi:molybdate transport system substrate-binding protein